jgi:hypothetical protein
MDRWIKVLKPKPKNLVINYFCEEEMEGSHE